MADDYTCTLNEFFLKKAKDELGEDPNNRAGAVETFRSWINSQKHIKCPTDTRFLLMFLRVAKFSQLVAREYLINYLTLIQKKPEYFSNIDMADEKIQAYLDTGNCVFPEARDPQGRKIAVMRTGVVDPTFKKYDKADMFKAMIGTMNYLQYDEANQVAGYTYFMDLTNFSLAESKIWSLDDMKLSGQMWNKCFPGRFKEFHYYNHGAVFETVFDVFKTFLSKKMKDRIRFHGSNMESIYQVIDKKCLPVEYLPDDYKGPNAGTMQELIDDLKKKVAEPATRERILYETSNCGIDLTTVTSADVPQASFRKLNVD